MATKTAVTVKTVAFVIMMILIIVDIIWEKELMDHSSDISRRIQQGSPSWVFVISNILSTWGVYWMPVLLHFYIIFNRDITYMVYIVTLYLLPFTIVFTLKAIYYRGRPFVINQQVIGCECDAGMPSGHAIMSTVTYYILYKLMADSYLLRSTYRRYAYRTILAIFCIAMIILVSFSRVVLGAHSYFQLIVAIAIGINMILTFTYKNFKAFVRWMRGRFKLIALFMVLYVAIFVPLMIYINHSFREDTTRYWKYWNKCPKCKESFVIGQTQSLSLMFFLPFFYFFFPIKYVIREEDLDIPDPEEQEDEQKFLFSTLGIRYLIYLGVTIPAIIFFAIFQFVIKPWASKKAVDTYAYIIYFSFFIGAAYLGFAWTYLKTKCFEACHVNNNNDYIDIKYLINHHRKFNPQPYDPTRPHKHDYTSSDQFGRESAKDDPQDEKNKGLFGLED